MAQGLNHRNDRDAETPGFLHPRPNLFGRQGVRRGDIRMRGEAKMIFILGQDGVDPPFGQLRQNRIEPIQGSSGALEVQMIDTPGNLRPIGDREQGKRRRTFTKQLP